MDSLSILNRSSFDSCKAYKYSFLNKILKKKCILSFCHIIKLRKSLFTVTYHAEGITVHKELSLIHTLLAQKKVVGQSVAMSCDDLNN